MESSAAVCPSAPPCHRARYGQGRFAPRLRCRRPPVNCAALSGLEIAGRNRECPTLLGWPTRASQITDSPPKHDSESRPFDQGPNQEIPREVRGAITGTLPEGKGSRSGLQKSHKKGHYEIAGFLASCPSEEASRMQTPAEIHTSARLNTNGCQSPKCRARKSVTEPR